MRLVGSQGLRGPSRERPFRGETHRAARAENEERSGASNKIAQDGLNEEEGAGKAGRSNGELIILSDT